MDDEDLNDIDQVFMSISGLDWRLCMEEFAVQLLAIESFCNTSEEGDLNGRCCRPQKGLH